jgi:3-oxoacyl-[acyl-carrier-protein] synthase-3
MAPGPSCCAASTGRHVGRPRGVLASTLHSDGRQHDILYVDGGPSSTRTTASCAWKARRSSSTLSSTWRRWSARFWTRAGLDAKDIDWLVPHQANKRIIDGTGRKLGLPPERVVVTVDQARQHVRRLDSPGARSAVKDGRIKQGDLLLLEGIGGGLAGGLARPLVAADD